MSLDAGFAGIALACGDTGMGALILYTVDRWIFRR